MAGKEPGVTQLSVAGGMSTRRACSKRRFTPEKPIGSVKEGINCCKTIAERSQFRKVLCTIGLLSKLYRKIYPRRYRDRVNNLYAYHLLQMPAAKQKKINAVHSDPNTHMQTAFICAFLVPHRHVCSVRLCLVKKAPFRNSLNSPAATNT